MAVPSDLESPAQLEIELILKELAEAQSQYQCLVQPINEVITDAPSGTPLQDDVVRIVHSVEAVRTALEEYARTVTRYLEFLRTD